MRDIIIICTCKFFKPVKKEKSNNGQIAGRMVHPIRPTTADPCQSAFLPATGLSLQDKEDVLGFFDLKKGEAVVY